MNSILDGGRDDEQEVRGNAAEPDLYPYAGGRANRGAAASEDREITLGTMTVLAIFFALAVVCAGFFGFGYSVGSKRAATQSANSTLSAPGTQTAANVPGCKPAPGSPLLAATPVKSSSSDEAAVPPASTAAPVVRAAPSVAPVHMPERNDAATASAPVAVAGPVAAGAMTMVQVAALSHQSDAELVASTLKSRGYTVSIHNSPQDSLLHVQVGPFTSRKDAEAMRQRLLNDGFNAILK